MGPSNWVEGGNDSSPVYTRATSRLRAPVGGASTMYVLTGSCEGSAGPSGSADLKSWSPPIQNLTSSLARGMHHPRGCLGQLPRCLSVPHLLHPACLTPGLSLRSVPFPLYPQPSPNPDLSVLSLNNCIDLLLASLTSSCHSPLKSECTS